MYFNKTNTSVSCLKSPLCLILLLFLEINHRCFIIVLALHVNWTYCLKKVLWNQINSGNRAAIVLKQKFRIALCCKKRMGHSFGIIFVFFKYCVWGKHPPWHMVFNLIIFESCFFFKFNDKKLIPWCLMPYSINTVV